MGSNFFKVSKGVTLSTQVGAPSSPVDGDIYYDSVSGFQFRQSGSFVGLGTGSGTVTSVAMTVPTFLSVAGSPVTTSGTLAVTLSGTALPVANGGTNSTTALSNNRVIQSSGGAIVEAATITANRALASDANGIPVASATTATELGFVSGVTSSIQTQIDTLFAGIAFKDGDQWATTAALPAVTYANGASGVGATLTGVSVGALTVDGNAVSVGERILVKNQVSGLQNGNYSVTAAGSGIAVFVLTRSTDFDTSAKMDLGSTFFIQGGTVNANTQWTLNNGPITVGTTALTFVQTAGNGTITVGTIDSQSKSANGGVITGSSLVFQTADATNPGLVSTGSQTLAGNKTISGTTNLSALTASLPLQLDASKNIVSTAINLSGSQVTSTLPVANGGTGQTSYTNGQLLIGNTTGNTLAKASLTAGTGISITPGAGSITIASTVTSLTTSTVTADTTMVAGTRYVVNKASTVAKMTLPATAAVGDEIAIVGVGSGGWSVYSNASAASQTLNLNGTTAGPTSSTATTLRTSSSVNDAIHLICVTANTVWNVVDYVGTAAPAFITSATGGTITTDGDFKVHTFTSSGTFQVLAGTAPVRSLVIAGGGGGGSDSGGGGGGGGAGGFIHTTPGATYTVGSFTVTVGAGGAGGVSDGDSSDGSNSVFDVITATGGGGGGSGTGSRTGHTGGSGGGGDARSGGAFAGGAGTGAQGFAGGAGSATTFGPAGGGGGSGGVGANGATGQLAGNGGVGTANSISGASVTYASGGGGGIAAGTVGTASAGGGSNGSTGTASNATANTGGGAGGGSGNGGTGGSGVVILRYQFQG